jgi:hypothetical protein
MGAQAGAIDATVRAASLKLEVGVSGAIEEAAAEQAQQSDLACRAAPAQHSHARLHRQQRGKLGLGIGQQHLSDRTICVSVEVPEEDVFHIRDALVEGKLGDQARVERPPWSYELVEEGLEEQQVQLVVVIQQAPTRKLGVSEGKPFARRAAQARGLQAA